MTDRVASTWQWQPEVWEWNLFWTWNVNKTEKNLIIAAEASYNLQLKLNSSLGVWILANFPLL